MRTFCLFILLLSLSSCGQDEAILFQHWTINCNDENTATFYPILEHKVENYYSLGLGIEQFLLRRFSGEIFVRYVQLRLSATGGRADNHLANLSSSYNPIHGYLKNNFNFGAILKYSVIEELQLLGGISYINHGKISHRETLYNDRLSKKMWRKANEREVSLIVGCSYAFANNFQVSLIGQRVFWQNSTEEFLYLNPSTSISLQLSYRFKVLDKLKKKSKVNCPKL